MAGGRPEEGDTLWPETHGGQKAWIDLAGRPMVEWVLAALLGSRHIHHVIVIGLDKPLVGFDRTDAVEFVADQGSLVANIYAGVARLTPGQPAAFCWADMPLLTREAIDRFIDQVSEPSADITCGVVEKSSLQHAFPGADDLWLRIREGQFIAAGFGLFVPEHAVRARRHLEALLPQRKSAARQALYVGLPLLVRYVLGRLTIPKLEAHLRRRFDLECRVLIVDDPEMGLDVDNANNLAVCRRALIARRAGP